MLKVLSKEPAARYRTADQLGRVLIRFGTQRDAPAAPSPAMPPETAPSQPRRDPPSQPRPTVTLPEIPIPEISVPDIDWVSVGLGLLALITVGGLIPFWIYIYFLYNPR